MKRSERTPWTFNAIPMSDIAITTGTLYRTDDPLWNNETNIAKVSPFLPTESYAGDQPQHIRLCWKKLKNGGTIPPKHFTAAEALQRAYIRIYSKDQEFVRVLVIDIDRKNAHEDWIKRLPRPNYVIITPTSGNCQLHYFLAPERNVDGSVKEFDQEKYDIAKNGMANLVGADLTTPVNFKSPFFAIKDRPYSYVKKGINQADHHYVIFHHFSVLNVGWLYATYWKHAVVKSTPKSTESGEEVKRVIKPTDNAKIDQIIESGEKEVPEGIRHDFMVKRGTTPACRAYSPKLSDEANYNNMFAIFNEHSSTLPIDEVVAVAKSTLNYCKENYDPNKQTHNYTPQAQRYHATCRWEQEREFVGELLTDAAKRLGIPYRTAKSMKHDGRMVREGFQWMVKSMPRKYMIKTVEPVVTNVDTTNPFETTVSDIDVVETVSQIKSTVSTISETPVEYREAITTGISIKYLSKPEVPVNDDESVVVIIVRDGNTLRRLDSS